MKDWLKLGRSWCYPAVKQKAPAFLKKQKTGAYLQKDGSGGFSENCRLVIYPNASLNPRRSAWVVILHKRKWCQNLLRRDFQDPQVGSVVSS